MPEKTKKRVKQNDTNRLFLDQIQYLNKEAQRTGVPKAALIRQSIDEKFGLPKPEEQ